MDKQDVIKYWLTSAKNDQDVAETLYDANKYSWSLFLWQLVIEKHLKALIVQTTDTAAPTTHDLKKLAKTAQLSLTPTQLNHLKEISSFNIDARYDDYKYSFYKKATKPFADKWIKIIQEFLIWLKQQN